MWLCTEDADNFPECYEEGGQDWDGNGVCDEWQEAAGDCVGIIDTCGDCIAPDDLDNFNQTQSGYYTNQLVNAVWYGCSSGNWGGQPGGGQGFGTEEFYNGYFNTIVQEQGASSVTEAQANACSCFPS